MRFSLNLVELYNDMTNEYGEPLSIFMGYDEFIDRIEKRYFTVVKTCIGTYIVLDMDE